MRAAALFSFSLENIMVSIVLTFALVTAIFEAFILLKFFSAKTLQKRWIPAVLHIFVIAANLAIHWGTIVGTMTAITAGLVSFAVVPAVIWLKVFKQNYREQRAL